MDYLDKTPILIGDLILLVPFLLKIKGSKAS